MWTCAWSSPPMACSLGRGTTGPESTSMCHRRLRSCGCSARVHWCSRARMVARSPCASLGWSRCLGQRGCGPPRPRSPPSCAWRTCRPLSRPARNCTLCHRGFAGPRCQPAPRWLVTCATCPVASARPDTCLPNRPSSSLGARRVPVAASPTSPATRGRLSCSSGPIGQAASLFSTTGCSTATSSSRAALGSTTATAGGRCLESTPTWTCSSPVGERAMGPTTVSPSNTSSGRGNGPTLPQPGRSTAPTRRRLRGHSPSS